MKGISRCGNSTRQTLCRSPCKTCIKRSFLTVEITKKYGKEIVDIVPSEYWSSKNKIGPECVPKDSNTIYRFECGRCDHEFRVKISDCVKRRYWCQYCAGKRLCDEEDCEWCYKKSFASVEKSWGRPADFIRDENPRLLPKYSHKKCKFYCSDCDHDFETHPYNVTQRDWPCSYCKGDKLCGSYDCDVCFKNSFASHDKSEYWSFEQNDLEPIKVRKSSNEKYWFDCPTCPHSFESDLSNIKHGNWCPYCCPTRVVKLCGDSKCAHCWNRSLASIVKKKNYIKGQTPLCEIPRGSRERKYSFICDSGHEFKMLPNNVNYQWCPMCPKKTETKVYNWLRKTYPDYKIDRQASFEWCKSLWSERFLYYDFYIKKLNIIIEVDGPQHFRQVSNWTPPEVTQEADKHKERRALKHGISIIRVIQTDVLFDVHMGYDDDGESIGWQDRIKHVIDSLKRSRRKPCIINITAEE